MRNGMELVTHDIEVTGTNVCYSPLDGWGFTIRVSGIKNEETARKVAVGVRRMFAECAGEYGFGQLMGEVPKNPS